MCNEPQLRVAMLLVAAMFGASSLGCERAANVAAKTSGPSTAPSVNKAGVGKANADSANADSADVGKADVGNADSEAVIEATFDDLKFDMEANAKFEQSMLTPKIHSLFDRQIRIRGYIFPTLKKRGIKQFVLVRDNLECCFGPGAALFDCILVHMQEGKTAEFSIRPVAVEGKFSLEEFLDYDGTVRAIYRLDGKSVE